MVPDRVRWPVCALPGPAKGLIRGRAQKARNLCTMRVAVRKGDFLWLISINSPIQIPGTNPR